MPTVRQHYVPQGYLKGFASQENTPFVWVYDKRDGRKPQEKSVKSQAYEDYYYSQETSCGQRDVDSVEKLLAQMVDNDIPPLIKSIQPSLGRPIILAPSDKEKLAFFIALGLTRVPSFRNGVNDIFTWAAQFALSEVASRNAEISETIREYGISAKARDWVSLRPMVQMAEIIGDSLLRKNWQFYIASENVSFMTSDNPIVIAGSQGIGPAHPQSELMLSLRKDLALVCTPRGTKRLEVFKQSASETRRFNRGIVQAARFKVFADHYSITTDAFVKKYRSTHQHLKV
ncbi:TPA: DUF4238 domain-containing protein [Pseudomonas putida]|nr:DUF4238 domain-containing protein [Pseudomonas putida]